MARLWAVSGVGGALLTLTAGAVHPKGSSDVGTVDEWMTRVGESDLWIADHLALLCAAVLLLIASIGIARSFVDEPASSWAEAARTTNVIATGVAVMTFLFDGAVVKNVATMWHAHPDDAAVEGAARLATEAGFVLVAGLQLTTGMVAVLFAVAGLSDTRYPKSLAILALTGGAAALIPGAVHYLAGSSTWSVSLVYVSNALVAIWFLLMSLRLWRAPTEPRTR